MIVYKDYIFSLFSKFDKTIDSNKDGNNKGTFERYNEIVGDDIDTEILPFITNLVDDNLNVDTALLKFLPYLYQRTGINISLGDTEVIKRKLLKYIHRLYSIKSTEKCYEVMINYLGFDVVIELHNALFTFDSDTTFDDDVRTFDMFCPDCSEYTLKITGVPGSLTAEETQAIKDIIRFNEPINTKIRQVTYNGLPVAGDFSVDYNDDYY